MNIRAGIFFFFSRLVNVNGTPEKKYVTILLSPFWGFPTAGEDLLQLRETQEKT